MNRLQEMGHRIAQKNKRKQKAESNSTKTNENKSLYQFIMRIVRFHFTCGFAEFHTVGLVNNVKCAHVDHKPQNNSLRNFRALKPAK